MRKSALAAVLACLLLQLAGDAAAGAHGQHLTQLHLPNPGGLEAIAARARGGHADPRSLAEGASSPSPAPGADGEQVEKRDSIAQVLGEALKEEFKHDEEEKQGAVGKQFNATAKSSEAQPETVLLISGSQKKASAAQEAAQEEVAAAKNRTAIADANVAAVVAAGGGNTAAGKDAAAEAAAAAADEKEVEKPKLEMAVEADVDRIIDSHDNEYVLSRPNEEGSMSLTLDPQLVRDLAILVAASAAAGLLMESLGQPTINGFLLAGSLVGPGGLKWIKELVQVQSVAQLGVQLLLFSLGLEFSLSKLRAVRNVALLGGTLQIALFVLLGALGARLIGTGAAQGALVGAFISMSSTSIVVKCLAARRAQNTPAGQITIGTLILQDCMVGLLFALLPVVSGTLAPGARVDLRQLAAVLGRVLATLGGVLLVAALGAAFVLPTVMNRLARHCSSETYQLISLALCFLTALATTRLGVSAELGAFLAGVVMSSTEQQEAVLHQLEPVSHFFLALFIASTGLVLSPRFLLHHLPVLGAGVMLVVVAKSLLIGGVVLAFGYPVDTALAVGVSLAQVGEFVFVLLSGASQYGLLTTEVYLLLMGVTALSLLVTPVLLQIAFKLLPRARASAGLPSSVLEMMPVLKRLAGGDSPPPAAAPTLRGSASESGSSGVRLLGASPSGAALGHRNVAGRLSAPPPEDG